MSCLLKPGQPVRFNAANGSVGRIVEAVGLENNQRWLVKWYYGKDVSNRDITETGHYYSVSLRPISEEAFTAYSGCQAWTPEQRAVKAKYPQELQG